MTAAPDDPASSPHWTVGVLTGLPAVPYADLDVPYRRAVDLAVLALRAGDRTVLNGLIAPEHLGAAAVIAERLGITDITDMRLPDVLGAIAYAVDLPPADDIATAVADLPLPDMAGTRWNPRTTTAAWLRSHRSVHTRRAYLRDLTGWLTWLHDHGPDPREARRGDIDAYIATLTGRSPPTSAATVHRTLSTEQLVHLSGRARPS